jgi:MFS family permease
MDVDARAKADAAPRPRLAVFRNRRFVELWAGSTISLLGDQCYFIALPWLVIQVTGSSLTLGAIMMTAAIPRAVLMLMGGAVIDRFSARDVLMTTAVGRAVIVAGVAGLTAAGLIATWHLYVLALLFGIADAFSLPAANALMPSVVVPSDLQQANAVFQGSMMTGVMLAPAPAGWAIKKWGVAPAFWADAVSFVAVIAALVRLPATRPAAAGGGRSNMLASITDGLRYVMADVPLRNFVLMLGMLNLCTTGPFNVGLAWLAKVRFGSAVAYGSFMSSYGAGALGGMLLAGTMRKMRHRGALLLVIAVALGTGMPLIGLARQVSVVALAMAVIGASGGFASIIMTAWMQERVEVAYLGRVMSVLMFAAVGLMPLSLFVSGVVSQSHVGALFVAAGVLVVLTGIGSLVSRATREID